ncbi:hypothetical protein KHA94_00630 [Bacillus sp. FJAT-49705]|uniref:Peptidase S26 domain-containing protein n=1 Tax=Cytobacillus citreus TaxID=2833586 RepID=A0ABS5NMR9_9BACI|nr:S26 family signal peptidase [Cytobacillus citreus]MBS4188723.1 hypothetical protein [Cytobacillus citreus]
MKYNMLLIIFPLVMVGCSFSTSTESLTDEIITPDIEKIEDVGSEMITHHHMYDNMDRGNHDYVDKTLVIDPNESEIFRGDVVFFINEDGEKDLSRVVALPNETIKISNSQIFINDKKLDTFYGKAHRVGLDKDSYFKMMDKEGNDYDKEVMKKVFDYNLKEKKLAENEYYVISDDWLRGNMKVLNRETVIGKVIGYTK